MILLTTLLIGLSCSNWNINKHTTIRTCKDGSNVILSHGNLVSANVSVKPNRCYKSDYRSSLMISKYEGKYVLHLFNTINCSGNATIVRRGKVQLFHNVFFVYINPLTITLMTSE
jgi:hypothetical protein